jgi:hypothetical protein
MVSLFAACELKGWGQLRGQSEAEAFAIDVRASNKLRAFLHQWTPDWEAPPAQGDAWAAERAVRIR